ncbi:hypothetical protein B296_00045471, partial [Ensete ventricosum]
MSAQPRDDEGGSGVKCGDKQQDPITRPHTKNRGPISTLPIPPTYESPHRSRNCVRCSSPSDRTPPGPRYNAPSCALLFLFAVEVCSAAEAEVELEP